MKLFKRLTLVNKFKNALKQSKQTIDSNKGLAAEVKNRLEYLSYDIEELLKLLPQLKPVYREVVEVVKEVF